MPIELAFALRILVEAANDSLSVAQPHSHEPASGICSLCRSSAYGYGYSLTSLHLGSTLTLTLESFTGAGFGIGAHTVTPTLTAKLVSRRGFARQRWPRTRRNMTGGGRRTSKPTGRQGGAALYFCLVLWEYLDMLDDLSYRVFDLNGAQQGSR